MSDSTVTPIRTRRNRFAEDAILDAAELLLEQNSDPDFLMRDLADEAGVSFATPFNYFGSKQSVKLALAHRIVSRIRERYEESEDPGDLVSRVLLVGRCGAQELLRSPNCSRAVVTSIVSPGPDGDPKAIRARSRELWRMALGDCAGIADGYTAYCNQVLPDQLAFAFRGIMTFWAAGELPSDDLEEAVVYAVAVQLHGFVEPDLVKSLIDLLKPEQSFFKPILVD